MIEGVVNERYEPVATITVQGPSGYSRQLDAVIDTGFNDFLMLPSSLVSELELPFETRMEVTVADGRVASLPVHNVSILWDGRLTDTYAYTTDATPLVGMLMLDGYDLNVEVKVGGRVVIQASE